MFNILINCGPAEDYIASCLASILCQSVQDWRAFVTIDPVSDATAPRAFEARRGDPRIHIHANREWQGPMRNTIDAIGRSNARPDDVMVVLDGDDKFASSHALGSIAGNYLAFDCWFTYGSWISDLPDGQGLWPAYPANLQDFRSHRWLGTAVRTWKRWLWDLVDDSDFRDASGQYFNVGEDQAILTPMLEMSGPMGRHIPEALMIYTRSSPHRVCYTRDEESRSNDRYIRSLPPYPRLLAKPDSPNQTQAFVSERNRIRQALTA